MNVAIVGCGLIGRKRALSLTSDDKLIACADINYNIAQIFSDDFSCQCFSDYKELLDTVKVDCLIVSVINKYAKDIIIDAIKKGINVVAEKPLGRNNKEAEEIFNASLKYNITVKTGFNHRFHPSIIEAKEIIDNGEIGEVLSIRSRYGHGGRPGMEKEWRSSKDLCGGGELLDQGIHIIDLCRWFGGEISEVFGKVETKFWNIEVEDNAYVYGKTKKNVTFTFNVSWTNWKNIFSFEIFGSGGYLHINGKGGSYGEETLEIGKRKQEGGIPDIRIIKFPAHDLSWKKEWCEFKAAVNERRAVLGNAHDGMKANEVIDAIYRSNITGCLVHLD